MDQSCVRACMCVICTCTCMHALNVRQCEGPEANGEFRVT